MMSRTRIAAIAVVIGLSALTAGCNATVGVGVSYGYPGPYYGPWGGGTVWVGGPVYR